MAGKKLVTLLTQAAGGYSTSDEKVRGVAVADVRADCTEINLSIINLAPLSRGEYKIYYGGDKVFAFPLDDVKGGTFIVEESAENAAVAIMFLSAEKRVCVAYGGFSAAAKKAEELTEYAQGVHDENPNDNSPQESGGEREDYDDEVVATENYYENKDVDAVNLTVKELNDVGRENGGKNENGDTQNGIVGEKTKREYDFGVFVDEEATKSVAGDYYEKIKAEVDKLFREFPAEEELSLTVPDSKWVKINYDGDKFYVVGVISDGKRPVYLCYGVAGRYGEKPEEIKEYCSFIPSSPYSLKGDGFWVMYQDAATGECLKRE